MLETRSANRICAELHQFKVLSDQSLKSVASSSDYEYFYTTYLKSLLRVRVPGTAGHDEVKKTITSSLESSGWKVEFDEFIAPTPIGNKKFINIIGTLQETADRRLVFAAHYDSKLMTPENGKDYIAATDSAVPCAMLLDLAKVLSDQFQKRKELVAAGKAKDLDVSPTIVFFDGEEAFVNWSQNDSLYGSRHLAEVYANKPHHSADHARNSISAIDAIDAFVLLDLIGGRDPQFLNMFESTNELYEHLQDVEHRLSQNGLIGPHVRYFPGILGNRPIIIADDHMPFMERGVPILHLIPLPYPKVWHTVDDDEEALDQTSIVDLVKILRLFVLEYFHLK